MQTDLNNIKNIIFDLGNVLMNLNFNATINAFQKLGLNEDIIDKGHAYSDPVFYQLEIGEIGIETFCAGIRQLLKNPAATNLQIEDAWYAIIGDVPEKRVKKLQVLNQKYRVFLYSNTNKLHIDRLRVDFKTQHGIEFDSLFEQAFYSHEIHDRKPNLSSFEKVIQLSGVNPEETLFVDDLEKNIIGAQAAGLQTFWLKEGMEMAEIF